MHVYAACGMVEWLSGLGNGLQNRLHGFDSRFHLTRM